MNFAGRSGRGAIACIVLGVLAGLLWVSLLATLSSQGGSDAAGNALGQAYAAIQVIVLWSLLAIMVIVASLTSTIARAEKAVALLLAPLSGVAAIAAADLLARPGVAPHLWPIVISAAVPPLLTIWCLVALLADGRKASIGRGAVLAAILAICASIVPLSYLREAADRQVDLQRQRYDADLARVPADAPLWEWTPYLATRNDTKREQVLDHVRALDRRQAEAETMLDRGDFPLGYLGFFDLDPTPSLCDKARALLRKTVAPLVRKNANKRPYREIALQVSDAVAAMSWLVGYGCSCEAESTAWESMAKGYSDTNFDVYRLTELRDPKELGRTLRESPTRFSMLGPQSHLKAWLKFTDDEKLREQALAGARKLDHRTADAVDMLASRYDDDSRWRLLRYLTALDLEPTEALCSGALAALRKQFSEVYRPSANDPPRPYSELVDRLGNDEPLPDLVWLAGHGCATAPELDEAIAAVTAYQDSPARARMLATLTELRSKR